MQEKIISRIQKVNLILLFGIIGLNAMDINLTMFGVLKFGLCMEGNVHMRNLMAINFVYALIVKYSAILYILFVGIFSNRFENLIFHKIMLLGFCFLFSYYSIITLEWVFLLLF